MDGIDWKSNFILCVVLLMAVVDLLLRRLRLGLFVFFSGRFGRCHGADVAAIDRRVTLIRNGSVSAFDFVLPLRFSVVVVVVVVVVRGRGNRPVSGFETGFNRFLPTADQ